MPIDLYSYVYVAVLVGKQTFPFKRLFTSKVSVWRTGIKAEPASKKLTNNVKDAAFTTENMVITTAILLYPRSHGEKTLNKYKNEPMST